MLVLTRYEGQKVMVGNEVVVEVLAIKGGRVKLGFHAPADMRVDRSEVRAKIDREGFDDRRGPGGGR